jgi:hypothetical protein
VLQVKATSELATGHSDRALADVMLMFRLAESLRDEPFLISTLVSLACIQITADVLWEGMLLDAWTEPQLATIQSRLKRFEFFQVMNRSTEGERAIANTFFDSMRRAGNRTQMCRDYFGDDGHLFSLIPNGWIYFEQLNYNRLMDLSIQPKPADGSARIDPSWYDQMERDQDAWRSQGGWLDAIFDHRIIAKLLLPALTRSHWKAAVAQANVEMAMLACALERFKLSRGAYPAALTELVPAFIEAIPNDAVAAVPYRYRREEGGRYVIYSIGWNTKDDLGAESKDLTENDWAWRY